jgi:hypothetical protein
VRRYPDTDSVDDDDMMATDGAFEVVERILDEQAVTPNPPPAR